MKHEHKICEHVRLKHCSKCDVVHCEDCDKEWKQCSNDWVIPYVPNFPNVYPDITNYPTWTTSISNPGGLICLNVHQ